MEINLTYFIIGFIFFYYLLIYIIGIAEIKEVCYSSVLKKEHKKIHLVGLILVLLIPFYTGWTLFRYHHFIEFIRIGGWIDALLYGFMAMYQIIHFRDERIDLVDTHTPVNLRYFIDLIISSFKVIVR